MKLKIDVNLNRAPKKLNKNNKNKNKNQPHASHTSHITTKNMSHVTMQKYEPCMWKYESYNHANHAETSIDDLGCVLVR